MPVMCGRGALWAKEMIEKIVEMNRIDRVFMAP
jgi:hypothetical protein